VPCRWHLAALAARIAHDPCGMSRVHTYVWEIRIHSSVQGAQMGATEELTMCSTHTKTLTCRSPCKRQTNQHLLLTAFPHTSLTCKQSDAMDCSRHCKLTCMHCKKWSHVLDIAVIHNILRRREDIPASCEQAHAEQRLRACHIQPSVAAVPSRGSHAHRAYQIDKLAAAACPSVTTVAHLLAVK
jgi:hypothetical protein